jgi:hypothetical protein
MIDLTSSLTSAGEANDLHQAFGEAGRRMVARGADVRVVVSTFIAAELRWICLFTADDVEVARRTADLAQIPERHVRTGTDLTALDTHRSAIA